MGAATEIFGGWSFTQQPPIRIIPFDITALPAAASEQELSVAMELVAARFGNDVNNSPGKSAVFSRST